MDKNQDIYWGLTEEQFDHVLCDCFKYFIKDNTNFVEFNTINKRTMSLCLDYLKAQFSLLATRDVRDIRHKGGLSIKQKSKALDKFVRHYGWYGHEEVTRAQYILGLGPGYNWRMQHVDDIHGEDVRRWIKSRVIN